MAEEIAEIDTSLLAEKKVVLKTHEMLNSSLSGDLEKLEDGYALVRLYTTEDMRADKLGLVHGGYIFSAADFAAMAAVNEPNVVLAGCDCQFLSPVRVGDEVKVEAKVRHKEGRKRNVSVTAHVYDIKVFEAEFKTVVTEQHVLKVSLLNEEEES